MPIKGMVKPVQPKRKRSCICSSLKKGMQQPLLSTVTIEGDLDPHFNIRLGERILIISNDQSYLTHGFHKYPTKFFPELPRWAIRKYSKEGDWVLDPMAGSGTVNVECILLKRDSIAIDVDPLARLLTRVKTTPLKEDVLTNTSNWLLAQLDNDVPSEDLAIPEFPYRDNWFRPEILIELAFIRKLIEEMPFNYISDEEVQKYKDFYRICMSSIIRAVSNADNNCTRTVVRKTSSPRVSIATFLSLFKRVIETNVPKMIEFSKRCPQDYIVDVKENDDARDITLDKSVDLAITSPPYINACDYLRTHQLEMYWLGLIHDDVLANSKRRYIGTEAVKAADYRSLKTFGNPVLDKLLNDIFEEDPRKSFIVYQYFVDMRGNLEEVKRVLKPGGRYIIVVGNNVIRGHMIPTHQILMDIAQSLGYKIENYFCSEVIRHFIKVPRKERIHNDWIMIFQSPSSKRRQIKNGETFRGVARTQHC